MLARALRFSLVFLALSTIAHAAKLPSTFNGFVTAVAPPGQFSVGTRQVTWNPKVTRIYQMEQGTEVDASATRAISLGAYLHVEGKFNKQSGKYLATSIGFLGPDETETRKISGLGLIEEEPQLRSDRSGAIGTLWVDGYPLQVTPQTKLLADDGKPFPIDLIRPNVWAYFHAVRQPDGSIEAGSITFEPNAVTGDEVKFRDKSEPEIDLPDYDKHAPGKIKFHYRGTPSIPWALDILPDKTIQDYVTKVGESLIPQYQKNLPASDSTKINFRFYVVERPSRWKEVLNDASATDGGVIVIPDNVLAALDNEAQLAAVLSNCIGATLEKQSYVHRTRLALHNDLSWAMMGGLYGSSVAIPNAIEANRLMQQLNEQASRIGLRYMLDAGYDIREAPFAWRAAANKDAENPQPGDYTPSSFEQSVMSDLYFNYASIDYSRLKTNREAYQRMVADLRRDDPKLPKAKHRSENLKEAMSQSAMQGSV